MIRHHRRTYRTRPTSLSAATSNVADKMMTDIMLSVGRC